MANPSLSPGARHQVSPRQFGGMQALALDKQLKHLALSSLNLPGYAAAPATFVLHSGFVITGALAREQTAHISRVKIFTASLNYQQASTT